MNAFKQQCIALRKKDLTLQEIMKITGRSKTSVYFHIKNIPLSAERKKQALENSGTFIKTFALARKGKSLRPFKPFHRWQPTFVLLVAHLMFDGELLRGKCIYNNRSSVLISRVQKLMCEVYDYSPKLYKDVISGVTTIAYHNVELQAFLKKKLKELLQDIPNMSLVFQREFIRAFFDDEGCMDFNPKNNTRRIRGYQNDKKILHLIKKLLKNFAIESKLQGRNEVVITGKENLKTFRKEINFSKGVKLNPNRKNSIWKKPIEKRELLDMAIDSFKS